MGHVGRGELGIFQYDNSSQLVPRPCPCLESQTSISKERPPAHPGLLSPMTSLRQTACTCAETQPMLLTLGSGPCCSS